MKIICNGEELEVVSDCSVAELVAGIGLKRESVVAECDGRILNPDEYEEHRLTDGARVELIRFVGGG